MAYTTAFRSTVQDVSDRSIRNMWTSSVGSSVPQLNTTVYWRTSGATQTKAVTEVWTASTTTPS